MCGIAGVAWTSDGEPVADAIIWRMTDVLAHRGPDDSAIYHSAAGRRLTRQDPPALAAAGERPSSPGAGLGQRRLSIIDLSTGQQPLANEDQTVWITFNGEIYNYRELRPDLEARGHRFRTHSDTETIVHLYEEYGPDCVSHLRGMFAFAIWDERKKRLFLARDRIGKKPLFYRLEADRLLFGSELKALLQFPGAPRELNPAALDLYLTYQYVPHPHCILEGYHKLPPAHWAIYDAGRLQIQRYWVPPFSEGPRADGSNGCPTATSSWTPERWKSELRSTLTEAVRLRMRSDVPLGAFLSGGIDSTIVSGLMQQTSSQPIHTFSIGFPVKQFDETSYAREAAAFLGTRHHEQIVEPHALSILPKLIWHYDEPFSDSSAIPTMYLSEMTRHEVTVALSGDGGDEMFCGYDRYRAVGIAAQLDRLPRWVKGALSSPLWQHLPSSVEQKSYRRRLKRLLAELGKPPERRYLRWINIFDDGRRHDLYTDEFAARLGTVDSADFLLAAYAACPDRDFVTRTTCADVLTYLPCDILTKVDIASMAFSLECRCPFLDHQVAELAARMPIELKQSHSGGKRILIDTFHDLLPPSIQTRSKMGFGVPLDHWFRGELRPLLCETLLDPSSLGRGYFKPESVRRLVEEHDQRRWDHSYRLWSLMCFELWQRTFLDPAEAPASPVTNITSIKQVAKT
ncbi:MAG TPA: asparagine synthase (glutamine-hydrolyzing) [Planctomycetaceae bacterium]|jgi:asparagine synthase (glutamine-hydrolysing)|nr:asparagine synthase (glutamine-hydrolyzing) [Planctomycetaceae bacterium]